MPLQKTSILAHPSAMRKALIAYLRAFPELEITRCEEDLQVILNALQQEGGDILVIYDEKSEWGLKSYLVTIRQAVPAINCIVIVPDANSRNELVEWGASTVLQRGLLEDSLRDAILGTSLH